MSRILLGINQSEVNQGVDKWDILQVLKCKCFTTFYPTFWSNQAHKKYATKHVTLWLLNLYFL